MATKSKTAVVKAETPDEIDARKKRTADITLGSPINAAVVMDTYAGKTFGEIDIHQLIDSMTGCMAEVNSGNLKQVENMLFGQSQALQSIFVNLARRAANQEQMKHYETFLRLALKAQSQCRATLETLAAIKNPPVVFAKQANIANGHQQINNGAPAREEKSIQSNELSGGNNELLTDTRASQAQSRVNQTVEAVGALDRAKVCKG